MPKKIYVEWIEMKKQGFFSMLFDEPYINEVMYGYILKISRDIFKNEIYHVKCIDGRIVKVDKNDIKIINKEKYETKRRFLQRRF